MILLPLLSGDQRKGERRKGPAERRTVDRRTGLVTVEVDGDIVIRPCSEAEKDAAIRFSATPPDVSAFMIDDAFRNAR